MEIRSFKRIDSTQRYLVEGIKAGTLAAPCAVRAQAQYDGIGSRQNRWEGNEGNFFASFALPLSSFPDDLPLASTSIYVSWLMREALHELGCRKVWVKWPNDLYQGSDKVGGTVTHLVSKTMVWGIGVNLKKNIGDYAALDCTIEADILFDIYVDKLKKLPRWKQVFREYEIEFALSRSFSVHTNEGKKSLEDAVLHEDGSLTINGRKVYGNR